MTSEGGVGMLQASGAEILRKDGNPVAFGIQELDSIESINTEKMPKELQECHFQIACDVRNPLCGKNGAVYVFGAQKGVREEEKEFFDRKMAHFAEKTKQYIGNDYRMEEGAGAAGGLGFAFLSYFPNVELKPGIDIVIQATGLEQEIKEADIVVTGEGFLDAQTAMGKAPFGIACLAKKYHAKVLAFAGGVAKDATICNTKGIDAFFPIAREAMALKEAMEPANAKENMKLAAEQVFRLLSFFY